MTDVWHKGARALFEADMGALPSGYVPMKWDSLTGQAQADLTVRFRTAVQESGVLEQSSHFSDLTFSQMERLHMLSEEAAEVIKASMKVLRHGYENYNPDYGAGKSVNREDLQRELGDLFGVAHHMQRHKDVDATLVGNHASNKLNKSRPYMHYYEEPAVRPFSAEHVGKEPVPPNVYYSKDEANFYSVQFRTGMGHEFWTKWKHRREEFPPDPIKKPTIPPGRGGPTMTPIKDDLPSD